MRATPHHASQSIRLRAGLALASIAIVPVLAGCADSSRPLGPTPGALLALGGTSRFSAPFTFTIPAGTCGLTTAVSGSGNYEIVETLREGTSDGTRVVGITTARAHGIALGVDGSRYTFNYVNILRWFDAPPGSSTGTFVDVFRLLGRGEASNIGLTVQTTFEIDADGNLISWVVTQRNGDFACDPI